MQVETQETPTLDAGRLIALKFKRNGAARDEALKSIRPVPGGKFTARIGGRVRGRTERFLTRRLAEKAVNDHYNGVMMQWLQKRMEVRRAQHHTS